ncbi:MAG: hypothetical protein GKC07_01570 [Methanomicrobiales archaeon]|nr:hypothetical protein [Methanomicrobiales archaeon]
MRKILIHVLILIFLTGCAMADSGIPAVPETQGIVTSTSINAVGNFASATEVQWRITTNPAGLPGTPPLAPTNAAIYESTYTEDTQSDGTGLVLYDKELDVETSSQISGQWNIEATKQIAFVGIDGASVVSSDAIMVDGASGPFRTPNQVICPFAEEVTGNFATFCNRAEAGSTIDMTVANVRTTTTDRFVMPSADHPVELNHDIRVSELVTDVPSVGFASAYMEVLIQEAPRSEGEIPLPQPLAERIEFTEETTADGAITLFEKLMHYESGVVR